MRSVKRTRCGMNATLEGGEGRGLAWLIGGFLICPCHLPLTLSLLATLLSGSAAGALLRGHPLVAGAVVSAAWLAATWRGIRDIHSAQKCADLSINDPGRGSGG
jgi:mercuric ion transport protein